jgi:hypothetical protein
MAGRYVVHNMGIPVPTMAAPTVAMAPDFGVELLQDLDMDNEPALFSMDGPEFVLEEDKINILDHLTDDVDQAQVRYGMKSHRRPLT